MNTLEIAFAIVLGHIFVALGKKVYSLLSINEILHEFNEPKIYSFDDHLQYVDLKADLIKDEKRRAQVKEYLKGVTDQRTLNIVDERIEDILKNPRGTL